MQCKDIPDKPILFLLAKVRNSMTWFPDDISPGKSVCAAMPAGTPPKLVLAKMRRLIERGLVDGCACGCYGHFTITAKGKQILENNA